MAKLQAAADSSRVGSFCLRCRGHFRVCRLLRFSEAVCPLPGSRGIRGNRVGMNLHADAVFGGGVGWHSFLHGNIARMSSWTISALMNSASIENTVYSTWSELYRSTANAAQFP
eukprot:m.60036 g.60036  ORF g.60036 m.60036 type:complete len:114 (+) comp17399_c0_seq7:171-512(+)